MDSLYLTALQDDHLSLQQMMDDDLKREMDIDECFSFGGDLPSLALEDSLDLSNLLSRHTPLHSPSFDSNLWYTPGGSSNSNFTPVLDNDPANRMVNPNSVIPLNSLSPTPMVIEPKVEPVEDVLNSEPVNMKAETDAEPIVPQQITFTTATQLPARAKISNKGISLVCSNTNTPFTFVKTNTFNISNNTLSINEGMATIRCPPRPNKSVQPNPDEKVYPKPAYSYSCLIALALKNSASGSLPVSEIYNFMCEHFPYFKTAPNGWKNSVRHNLSLNKCFEKIEKPSGNGSQRKGCLWAMNPSKLSKMDEEVQKWSRKDPQAIRRAMVIPENLEMLERGEMKRDVPSGDDTEEDEDEELPCSISPPNERQFTPPAVDENEDNDPIETSIKTENEFVDISYLDELDENDIPEFDLDVNDGLYEEMEEEEEKPCITKVEAPIITNQTTKIQGNYIYKTTPITRPIATAPISSYICKPTANGTAVRIRKVQPAILLSSVKRH
ncbi:forkhead box protein A2-B isoform X2 [Neocloeon triangulifer]|uniref:forkhead box protein A2-B isoform X2 n=1 Tax=Neocloeon triangulifer TaxID=2078957 RepID=UPI00286ED6AF|nr:forkhead box protein A2-B isoform X2 [Neocloeon triangulifer]